MRMTRVGCGGRQGVAEGRPSPKTPSNALRLGRDCRLTVAETWKVGPYGFETGGPRRGLGGWKVGDDGGPHAWDTPQGMVFIFGRFLGFFARTPFPFL